MALPHFEVATFPGQILWLLITATGTYLFSKFFFIPLISSAISKRQKIIQSYIAERNRTEEHIMQLRTDMAMIINRGKLEARIIIEEAVNHSQSLLLDHANRTNKLLSESIKEYDNYIEKTKLSLSQNAFNVVESVKDKMFYFISRQNI